MGVWNCHYFYILPIQKANLYVVFIHPLLQTTPIMSIHHANQKTKSQTQIRPTLKTNNKIWVLADNATPHDSGSHREHRMLSCEIAVVGVIWKEAQDGVPVMGGNVVVITFISEWMMESLRMTSFWSAEAPKFATNTRTATTACRQRTIPSPPQPRSASQHLTKRTMTLVAHEAQHFATKPDLVNIWSAKSEFWSILC